MLLLRGFVSISARPSSAMSGRTYIPNRPRSPFLRPYQPPTGLSGEAAQASTVPSAAGFCSSGRPGRHPVAVRFQHRVEILDAAQVVAKLGLADAAHQGSRQVERLVPEHLVLRPAARPLQHPGALACRGAHRGEHTVVQT
jgi:hypothetical protein